MPSGWRPLAELVAEKPAARGVVQVESRSAYGDPASGCYALVQRVSAPAKNFDEGRATAALLEQLKAAGFTAGPGAADLPFLGRGVQGRLRSTTTPGAGDRIVVRQVACFYNDREPDRCRQTCDAMLDSAGVRR